MAGRSSEAWSRLGGLDMLVNNAGIGMRTVNPRFMTEPQGFWEVPADGFRAVIDTNLTGYFLVAREVTPRMLAAGGGRIVNISVNHSTMHRAGFVPYGPSRAGSEALSRIMAADLRGTGVTVNLLLPGGATVTGMLPDDVPAAGPALPRSRGDGPADRLAGLRRGRPACTTSASSPPSSTTGCASARPAARQLRHAAATTHIRRLLARAHDRSRAARSATRDPFWLVIRPKPRSPLR